MKADKEAIAHWLRVSAEMTLGGSFRSAHACAKLAMESLEVAMRDQVKDGQEKREGGETA